MSLRYTVTRIPRNSSDGIFRDRKQPPWQRLDMVLCHFFHKPELRLDMVSGYFSYKIHYYSFHTRDMFHISFLINFCHIGSWDYTAFPPQGATPNRQLLRQRLYMVLSQFYDKIYYFIFLIRHKKHITSFSSQFLALEGTRFSRLFSLGYAYKPSPKVSLFLRLRLHMGLGHLYHNINSYYFHNDDTMFLFPFLIKVFT